MASRQFEHLQEQSLARLRALVVPGCPLHVMREPRSGFRVMTTDGLAGIYGRFQIVAAWIAGYVTAWCLEDHARRTAEIAARIAPADRAEILRLVDFAASCTCRTAGCGHRGDQHGPGGWCVVCEKACWS